MTTVHAQADSSDAIRQLRQLQDKFSGSTLQQTSSAELVEVTTALNQDGVRPGDLVSAAVILDIKEGWHINAHEPTLDYLIGTTLEPVRHPNITVTEYQYPTPTKLALAFAGEELAVYEGRTTIFVKLRVAEGLTPGRYTLMNTLRIQACNDQMCLPPSTLAVPITVAVVPSGRTTASINKELFSQ